MSLSPHALPDAFGPNSSLRAGSGALPEPATPAPLKVLVADDSPLAAKMVATVLMRAGYQVVTAADGIEAVQAVYRECPDVILLDIFMPRMNGYQVCRLIKADKSVAHIPVLINTASERRSAEFWSLHTGADAFILKGAPAEELLGAVARLSQRAADVPKPIAAREVPGPEEILCQMCALVDQELYETTVKRMELQTMLANLTEGILIVDSHGTIGSANHFLCEMLGVEAAGLLGRGCDEALGEIAGDTTRQLVEAALRQGHAVSREGEVTSSEGKKTPVEISAIPVSDYLGDIVGAVCVFQDISRRREIETLNQLKNDLTDMIVHDLRTPLTSLMMGLETVGMLGELNADQNELMNISIGGGQILLGMINDLLDISKMEDGSMLLERSSFSVADLIERARSQVVALAEAKRLTLNCEIASEVLVLHADADKLLRTLVNLLANAIKFTPARGSITLGARLVKRPGRRDSIVFVCRDTGEGIPDDAFSRIFDKFGQVESRSAGRMMSTGLGLTFCKMAVEAHEGRIWVQSTLGQGSTFSFAIPVETA